MWPIIVFSQLVKTSWFPWKLLCKKKDLKFPFHLRDAWIFHDYVLSWKSKLVTSEQTRICCKQMPCKIISSLRLCLLRNPTCQRFEFFTLLFRAICKSGFSCLFVCFSFYFALLLCESRFLRRWSDEFRSPRHCSGKFVSRLRVHIVQYFRFSYECLYEVFSSFFVSQVQCFKDLSWRP